jgi:arabinofuranosyltransferase
VAFSRKAALLLLLSLTTLLALVLVRTAWTSDDAYITFRTADNFVRGYGLRWNTSERVQAYSHPLWLFLFALPYSVSREPYYTAIGLSIVTTLVAFFLYGWRLAASVPLMGLGFVCLMSSKAFLDYSASGLENPLTGLLLIAFVLFRWHRPATSSTRLSVFLTASLLVLNRMDAGLLILPAFIQETAGAVREKQLRFAALGLVPLAAWEIFSIIYYGFPFPNTAYAKLDTGIPAASLVRQGLSYYADSLSRDPITLPVVAAAVIVALADRRRRDWSLAAGIVLFGLYVLRIGGDFMSGRFFMVPFVAAVCLLTGMSWRFPRLVPAACLATVMLAATAPTGLPFLTSGDYGITSTPADKIDAHGIADERGFYYPEAGLLRTSPGGIMPNHGWSRDGDRMRREGPLFAIRSTIGFVGYFAGPHVTLLDCNALSDPLLARLPVDTTWRIGHFSRRVPAGYVETLKTGKDDLRDPSLRTFYGELSRITRDPIWDRERWRAIFRMNTGQLDYLLDGHTVEPTLCDHGNYIGRDPRAKWGNRAGRGSSGIRSASSPPAATISDNAMRPPRKLSVAVFTRPTSDGPTKPPRFPIELISAMPPAAADPVRNAVGSVQNGPSAPQMPAAAMQNETSDSRGTVLYPLSSRPAAPASAGNVTCHRRSPVLSECAPTYTMTNAAATYGIADRIPTIRSPNPENPLIIWGSQKLTP